MLSRTAGLPPGGGQASGCHEIMSPRTDFWDGLELDDIATHLQPGPVVGLEAAHFSGFEAVLNEEPGELCHIPDLGDLDQPCPMAVVTAVDPEPLMDVTGVFSLYDILSFMGQATLHMVLKYTCWGNATCWKIRTSQLKGVLFHPLSA
jgi:hypothetical protein